MDRLAELLRQGADRLVNLPSEAQRFITNPQAFTQLLTGKNPLPRETGFAAGATGLPAQEMSVLDPNQAPYMQGYTQGEPIGYAGMAAPFAAPATVATAKALAPKAGMMAENYMVKQGMIQPLTAYHGTPHIIQGQFDINKVGTGEGAQAYGYGMYFAENPAVAGEYKRKLSGGLGSPSNELMLNGQPLTDLTEAQRRAYEIVARDGRKNALGTAKDLEQQGFDASHIRDALNATKGKEISLVKNEGNLYKVDIPDADIPMMLDYDKPLSQQPKAVQEALAKYDPDMYGPKSADYDSAELGQSIYQRIIQDNVKKFGHGGNQQRTSEQLNALGIKGIRYLDEGSRQAGGTSNFVIFEPSTVKILEKNNKPVTRKELIQEQINKIE
jgi:hypothetical protein